MTSLFEFAEVPPRYEMPVELLANGTRGVAALRFAAVEEEQDAMPVAEPSEERLANERAQQMRVMIDAAREETAAEVRRLSSLECDEMLRTERQRVSRVCGEFARDRQRYFAAAEAQVVRLALAVARRVLAREVEAAGLPLESIVKAALARVRDGSATSLRVPRCEAAAWMSLFEDVRDGEVEVVADERLSAGECVLDTEVGRVELGVRVQMEEIERGFEALLCRQAG